jgi:hypothetical protein
MKETKLTPLEILQMQKKDLQVRVDELSGTIENRFRYMQKHFAPLLGNSLIETAFTRIPPQLRGLVSHFFQKEHEPDARVLTPHNTALGVVAGIAEIAPFFLKRKKGVFLSILLKLLVKFFVRR